MSQRLLFALSLGLGLSSCGGESSGVVVDPGGTGGGPGDEAGHGFDAGQNVDGQSVYSCPYTDVPASEALPTPREAEVLCQQATPLISALFFRPEEARVELAQRYVCCNEPFSTIEYNSVPCSIYGVAHEGIEFRSDGTWSFLAFSGDELVTRDGPDESGQWSFSTGGYSGGNCELSLAFETYSGNIRYRGGFAIARAPTGLLFNQESPADFQIPGGMHRYVATAPR
jgi:hypothetical protein